MGSLSIQQKREVIRIKREMLPHHQNVKNRRLDEILIISSIIKLVNNKGKKHYRQERRSISSFIESCTPRGGSLLITL